jgi:hypothetical protein
VLAHLRAVTRAPVFVIGTLPMQEEMRPGFGAAGRAGALGRDRFDRTPTPSSTPRRRR